MKTRLTLDGDIAAEIADCALEKVGHRVSGFGPADVIAHLCGATAGVLLGSLPSDQAIKSTEGWRLLLIEAIKQLEQLAKNLNRRDSQTVRGVIHLGVEVDHGQRVVIRPSGPGLR